MGAMEYDVVVVGGGAAGLTAAMVLARACRRVAVVDSREPRNAPAAHMHGFLSRDGMPPAHLLAVGRGEVFGYGGEVVKDRVLGVERTPDQGFTVRLAEGPALTTRAVLVATGLRDELPEIPGVRERWGDDVLHCPYCHGYEVRGTAIGVLGGEARELSLHQALLLRQWTEDLVFFPNRIALTDEERERLAARGVRVVDGEVARVVVEEDRVRAVEMKDGREVPRTSVFVAPRFVPRDELLRSLGCAVGDNGWVSVDPTGRTSVPGVWAAGNVVDPRAQVITAAGAGSVAAIAINGFLVEEDVDRAVADYRVSGEMFSNLVERRVSEAVVGDRRHGLKAEVAGPQP
ncbi:thioredoxin reductase (NADPH) [Streptoalloteichus tenebrarius]|uniref:Thioredoxin reductase (NADPH) n=2 Tax=Streptoalloteichus tenebrarius (strain ATCC 17920 / DSM 40477 / JCM 4838 / CBS 697.72 / NBRC 16177 / NCIMB 11028 / NRRL B-12390 / A12253. 1 / ISP 5477) TaxID=1933 RepID=A0ABT1I437_STRSD|nr:thioredoxin reductase (NADPH) [Streptoalloteichus tenebrarius]